jgi:hypothetical protein
VKKQGGGREARSVMCYVLHCFILFSYIREIVLPIRKSLRGEVIVFVPNRLLHPIEVYLSVDLPSYHQLKRYNFYGHTQSFFGNIARAPASQI